MWTLEKKKENRKAKKLEKARIYDEKVANGLIEEREYGLGANTMFLRFYDSTMNHVRHSRLMNAMMFGQPIVMDCGYEEYMTKRETKNCTKQLQLSFACNRSHDDPFDMYFCNVNLDGYLSKELQRFIPTVLDDDFPLHVKTESYLDLFDKKRLVYLTPHCHNEMTEFDHDAVYIIGAFVDRVIFLNINLLSYLSY